MRTQQQGTHMTRLNSMAAQVRAGGTLMERPRCPGRIRRVAHRDREFEVHDDG